MSTMMKVIMKITEDNITNIHRKKVLITKPDITRVATTKTITAKKAPTRKDPISITIRVTKLLMVMTNTTNIIPLMEKTMITITTKNGLSEKVINLLEK